jgi:hypothetical protein
LISRLVIQERHAQQLQKLLMPESGHERAAYILCSPVKIEADPWTGETSQRFISYEVLPIEEVEIISSSTQHITWASQSFVNVLKQAQDRSLVVALVHSHPGGLLEFSEQDNKNEADLIQLAQNRNGSDALLLSLIVTSNQQWIGRWWQKSRGFQPLDLIQIVGEKFCLHYPERGRGKESAILNRQALAFGEVLNQDLAQLRVGIIGVGGTGSAVAMLAAKLGVRNLVLFDRDIVEESNLNRLHGATIEDARSGRLKVDVVAQSLSDLGLGIVLTIMPDA